MRMTRQYITRAYVRVGRVRIVSLSRFRKLLSRASDDDTHVKMAFRYAGVSLNCDTGLERMENGGRKSSAS